MSLYRTLITCLMSGVALLAADMLPASASDRQSAAIAAVRSLISDVEAMLETQDADRDTRRGAITALLDAHFAMDRIAAFSTGPYWRAATPDEREAYKSVFRDVLVSTILNNFDQNKVPFNMFNQPELIFNTTLVYVCSNGIILDDEGDP